MLVRVKAPTYWDGRKLKAGDRVEVVNDVADRWERAGIASPLESASPPEPPVTPPDDTTPDTPPADGASTPPATGNTSEVMTLSALERAGLPALEKMAEKRGLDISGAKNNKERAKLIFEDINKGKE